MASLPASLIISVSTIDAAQGPLGPEEAKLLGGATHARRREFTAGRVLARRALEQKGLRQVDIVQSAFGAPIWPTGICGSIAHSSTHAAIAVARTTHIRSVGIDIDDGRDLEDATQDVATKAELRRLVNHPLAVSEAGAARLVFCAKEALYKCQAPLTGDNDLSFADVELFLGEANLVQVRPVRALDTTAMTVISAAQILIQQFQGVTISIAWFPAMCQIV